MAERASKRERTKDQSAAYTQSLRPLTASRETAAHEHRLEAEALALEEALAAQRRAEQLVAEMRNQLSQWLSANRLLQLRAAAAARKAEFCLSASPGFRQTMEVALRGFSKLASITGHKVPLWSFHRQHTGSSPQVPQTELKFMQVQFGAILQYNTRHSARLSAYCRLSLRQSRRRWRHGRRVCGARWMWHGAQAS